MLELDHVKELVQSVVRSPIPKLTLQQLKRLLDNSICLVPPSWPFLLVLQEQKFQEIHHLLKPHLVPVTR